MSTAKEKRNQLMERLRNQNNEKGDTMKDEMVDAHQH